MKLSAIIFISLIICESLFSQILTIDPSFRENLSSTKNDLYEKMIRIESEILASQEKFDIIYYSLDLRPNPETEVLTGNVEVIARISDTNLDYMELNFWSGMNILDIHMTHDPNSQLYYTHNDDILYISLDRSYLQNEEVSVTIGYNGQPQNSPYHSFDFGTKDGKPMIWTLSQPFGARAWWPCKDIPSDKADSIDIRITVPKNLIVVSNGSLRKKSNNGDETTYWWHEEYAIATYLVSLAIHPFIVYYDDYLYNGNSDTMKIHFYMFPENYDQFAEINAQTKDMISLFSDLFGQYPFINEKYAHADFLGGGAMEHQTCSSFGFWNQWVIVHELAHQWWGDLITCENFQHVWLNEGFATYSEALWYEHLNGPGTANYYQMTANLYLGGGNIFVEDPENEAIFDVGLSYSKGSWILHMLRHVVGDQVFFNILKTYYSSSSHQFGTSKTDDFRIICEQVSGLNLQKFFHQWVYEEYYPQYLIEWNWVQNDSNVEVQLHIKQKQENHTFWMPIDVTITTMEGEHTFVIWDSLDSQNFLFEVPSEPYSLKIDKDNWILKTVQEQIVDPTFDHGILLVNGVNFDVYGGPIRAAYENRAFWGEFPISFWDCFNPPEDDYPSSLPEPLGHGRIPAEVLGKYSSIIWIGNNYQGDINVWFQTSILPYVKAGGNLFLITRQGQDFINEDMRNYLGINWAENTTNTLANCVSDYSGLVSMTFTDVQSSNAVYTTNFYNEESVLLFKETTSFIEDRALGIWKRPETGGTYRPKGGQFVFISGRPYRFMNQELRSNSEYILEKFFEESKIAGIYKLDDVPSTENFVLFPNYPNPFNPRTIITYELAITSEVDLSIYNLLGQKVATLVNENQNTGSHQVEWDGSDFTSGIYYYRIKAGNFNDVKKMILLK